ncbi:PepSY-like domain-containing protein [Labilibacter marinus]|uniref:PepSY-like domain-containing protein n=1 Tax=Labilibacter marinus TaxID=1477105 RepID=UPI00095010A2|nr:PepSY-like domain-containing protein [Labilibacter marinus]
MKKQLLIISALLFAVTVVFAQDINVPKAVKSAFDKKFPDAEKPVWKKAKDNYMVQFKDETKHQAFFAPDGKWLKTAAVIFEDELPEATSDYILETYEEFELKQAQQITNNKGKISYMVILLIGEDKVKLTFDELGEYIDK